MILLLLISMKEELNTMLLLMRRLALFKLKMDLLLWHAPITQ